MRALTLLGLALWLSAIASAIWLAPLWHAHPELVHAFWGI